jgi:HB1, ASXL, restriction endonuclease HTH domain
VDALFGLLSRETPELMLDGMRLAHGGRRDGRFQVSTKEAIEHVMKGKRRPMKVADIISAGLPLAKSLKGKTPRQTFYSVIYSEAQKVDGLVVQVDRGTFKLNPRRRKPNGAPAKAASRKAATSSRKRRSSGRRSASRR